MTNAQRKSRLFDIRQSFTPTEIGMLIERTGFKHATVYNYLAKKGNKLSTELHLIKVAGEIEHERVQKQTA